MCEKEDAVKMPRKKTHKKTAIKSTECRNRQHLREGNRDKVSK